MNRTIARRWVMTALCGIAAAACNDTTGPGSPVGVDLHRRVWESRAPTAYRYDLLVSCFCLVRPLRIVVANGAVIAATDAQTGTPLTNLEGIPTIDDLYMIAVRASRDAASLHIEYDRALSYPTHIAIDWNAQTADDEVTYEVSALAEVGP